MNKNRSGVRSERRTETINITTMEECTTSRVIVVGGKGEGDAEDDTQPLDLRGERDGDIFSQDREVMDFV